MEKTLVNVSEMLKIINDTPSVQMTLDMSRESAVTLIAFQGVRLSHIWINKGNNRVSYEKRDGEFKLVHYAWSARRGWVFVGVLKGERVARHSVIF